jgi:hypothetical protein
MMRSSTPVIGLRLGPLLAATALTLTGCNRRVQDVASPSLVCAVTTTYVNVRAAPGPSAPILSILAKGEALRIEAFHGDWIQVTASTARGFVHARYVVPVSATACAQGSLITPLRVEKFLPAHRRILETTGWLEYADRNIDALYYFDQPYFDRPEGPAVGLASFEHGRRIADVAMQGRADIDVVETIIHEAGHCAGYAQVGQLFSEDIAEAIAARFLRDYEQRHDDSRTGDSSRDTSR